MPYVMDKGPYLSVLEDKLVDPSKRAQFLASLKGPTLLSSLVGLNSTSLDGDGNRPDQRVAVLNQKWFGMQLEGGNWVKHLNDFPTGFWQGYQGDPEAILRAALIRAIEVSLGVDHGANPIARTRNWPIEISWVCQGPFFQCWVGWQESPVTAGGGHVTLTITSPAAEGLPVNPKITRTNVKPEYEKDPANNAGNAARGLWVFGHEDYTKTIRYSTIGSGIGSPRNLIQEPHVEWRRTSTDVVCVAPAEWEGGVLAAGRPYTP
jgi:hypothetical protein